MGSKWRKAKLALGLNMCLYVPHQKLEDSSPSSSASSTSIKHLHDAANFTSRFSSDGVPLSPVSPSGNDYRPTTPTPSSSGLQLSKSSLKSSKKTCSICLTTMKPGQGHAIFTAECSHSFHFQCITSNVKHGNQICPVCRAKWKEIPFRSPASDLPNGRSRINPADWPRDDAWTNVVRRLPSPHLDLTRQISSLFHSSEPGTFDDDDEVLDQQNGTTEENAFAKDATKNNSVGAIEVKTYPEVSAIPRATCHNNFAILIHLKAPRTSGGINSINQTIFSPTTRNSRAPVDLVTVLDVSGSMAGTKLALLKRAMGFVIQHLGPSDRLSVIAFSSTACRLFPLRRMTEAGRQEALQAVNSLTSNGGTNIAEGLRKGAKVIVDRKWKNPVGSIILLSDGQDTYTVTSLSGAHSRTDYKSLLPASIHRHGGAGPHIPVHAFGFGADHDAASMHSISEISGGTFSFIEAEGVIQDAFAQCIGGLLSVVVQEACVKVECAHSNLVINSIKAGSYRTSMTDDAKTSSIDVGDLYAEEERDFLVTVNVPVDESCDEMSLLKVRCIYRDPILKEMVSLEEANEVKIQRPIIIGQTVVSMEVDRQRNRLRAAEAMAEARAAAEHGDLTAAVSLLESCRRALSETICGRAGDRLCVALCAELKEMKERMANRHVYESSGRAYILSGLSSHSWQRATARGDSTSGTSLVQAYQTPTMTDMVTRSQTTFFGNPPQQRKLQQVQSFPARRQPRLEAFKLDEGSLNGCRLDPNEVEPSGDRWTCLCALDGLSKVAVNSHDANCFIACNCTAGSLTQESALRKHHANRVVVIILLLSVIFTTLAFLASVTCCFYRKDMCSKCLIIPPISSLAKETSCNSPANLVSHKTSLVPETKVDISFPTKPTAGCFQKASFLCRSKAGIILRTICQFAYSELENATNKFSNSNLIGLGGSSYVYRGQLKNGRIVAVKRLKIQRGLDVDSIFSTEVELLSRLHHCHVVPLLGYCSEFSGKHAERLLVFEYMPNGNLRDCLDGISGENMTWETRVAIAIDAARGLEYLHEAAAPRILHSDVKSTNFLLDKNWRAKITDLGMAKRLRADGLPSCSSSPERIQGTFGYFAPEYAIFGKASQMSDVFSFGVVLLELITGRQPIHKSNNKGESLVLWATPRLQDSKQVTSELPDPRLKGNFPQEEMQIMAYLAKECLLSDPDARPTMIEVVQVLSTIAPDKSKRRNVPVKFFQISSAHNMKNEAHNTRDETPVEGHRNVVKGLKALYDTKEHMQTMSVKPAESKLPLGKDANGVLSKQIGPLAAECMERLVLLSSEARSRHVSDDEAVDLTEPWFESFHITNV